jgi:hypothetical protein
MSELSPLAATTIVRLIPNRLNKRTLGDYVLDTTLTDLRKCR